MKCSIVVLHYKNLEDTQECIASLAKIDYPCFDIILVDNGSEDALAFQNVDLVRNATNLGFAEGCNRGLARALELKSTHILLLNNDTVVAPDILTAFMTAAEQHPEAAVFGAKIFYYDEPTILWHAGGDVDWVKLRCFHAGCTISDLDKKYETVRPIAYACGCALFVTAKAYTQVGGFDPAYFLLWEEIDWCFRLRKAGYQCLYVPKARLWHKISRSFEGGNRGALWQYYNFRNRLRFLQQHGTRAQRYRFYLRRFPKELLELLFGSFHSSKEQRRLHRAAFKGIFHYLLDLFSK
jgi:GT2 family glycosyltransferase